MSGIVRLCIFDFDGTLISSPEPTEENKKLWETVHERKWPHKGNGWWTKEESLCLKTFDIKTIEHVKYDALDRINDVNAYTVLLTGRMPKFQKMIKEILRKNGIPYFNAYYFNDSHRTLDFKLKVIEQLKNEFPSVIEFEMWEDRVEHIPSFVEWGEINYGKNFKINII